MCAGMQALSSQTPPALTPAPREKPLEDTVCNPTSGGPPFQGRLASLPWACLTQDYPVIKWWSCAKEVYSRASLVFSWWWNEEARVQTQWTDNGGVTGTTKWLDPRKKYKFHGLSFCTRVCMTSETVCPELPSPGHERTASSSDFESLFEIGLFWVIASMCSLGVRLWNTHFWTCHLVSSEGGCGPCSLPHVETRHSWCLESL